VREGATHLEAVGSVVDGLRGLGLEPILVGGMALVVLGSRRVTRDFGFVVARPGASLGGLVDVFYARGFELASRVDGRLKKIAAASRSSPGDAEDIAFLEARRAKRR
jgi:hypothetical protein